MRFKKILVLMAFVIFSGIIYAEDTCTLMFSNQGGDSYTYTALQANSGESFSIFVYLKSTIDTFQSVRTFIKYDQTKIRLDEISRNINTTNGAGLFDTQKTYSLDSINNLIAVIDNVSGTVGFEMTADTSMSVYDTANDTMVELKFTAIGTGSSQIYFMNPISRGNSSAEIFNTSLSKNGLSVLDNAETGLIQILSGDTTPPTDITGINAVAGNKSVTVTWTATIANDSNIYKVYYDTQTISNVLDASVTLGGTVAANIGETSLIISGLTNNQIYYFTVTCNDTAENEDTEPSEVVSATPNLVGTQITSAYHRIVMDGSNDFSSTELVGECTTTSSWGTNNLDTMWFSYEGETLYIGISGTFTDDANSNGNGIDDNRVIIYLDRDFGAGTGLSNMSTATDNTSDPDNAISNSVNFSSIAGFGADFALGGWGINLTSGSGNQYLRNLSDPSNFGWSNCDYQFSSDYIEYAIPITEIYNDTTIEGKKIALIAMITSNDGGAYSNQFIPDSAVADQNAIVVTIDNNSDSVLDNNSGWTPPVPDTIPPDKISWVAVEIGDGTATVKWSSTAAADSDYYKIFYSTTNITDITSVATFETQVCSLGDTDIILTGLTQQQQYYFTVVAYDTEGNVDTEPGMVVNGIILGEIPIVIDGDTNDLGEIYSLASSLSDEKFYVRTKSDSNLYLGVSLGRSFNADPDVYLFYIRTHGDSSSTSVDWNGVHTLPETFNYALVIRPNNLYYELRKADASGNWVNANIADSEFAMNYGNGGLEYKINLNHLGILAADTTIDVLAYHINGTSGNLYSVAPFANPTGTTVVLDKYWKYELNTSNYVGYNSNYSIAGGEIGVDTIVISTLTDLSGCTVTLYNASDSSIKESTISNSDGSYNLNPHDGTYFIKVKRFNSLTVKSGNFNVTGGILSGTINLSELKMGDVNNDNTINALDITAVHSSYNSNSNLNADLNGDNVVNNFDLSIVGGNFGSVGE